VTWARGSAEDRPAPREDRQDSLSLIRAALDGTRGADQQRIADAGLAWLATILRKNADYGSSAWSVPVCSPHLPPRTAILVRMSDKVRRIGTLAGGDAPQVASEALEDTIGDLGSYCLLWLTCPADAPAARPEGGTP
jgi:hypothetical protein